MSRLALARERTHRSWFRRRAGAGVSLAQIQELLDNQTKRLQASQRADMAEAVSKAMAESEKKTHDAPQEIRTDLKRESGRRVDEVKAIQKEQQQMQTAQDDVFSDG